MTGSAKAHYDGIKAFSETDQTEDLKAITLPVLVMQGDDDQVVPYQNAAILQDKLLPNSQLKIYPGFRTVCIPRTPMSLTPICWRLSARSCGIRKAAIRRPYHTLQA